MPTRSFDKRDENMLENSLKHLINSNAVINKAKSKNIKQLKFGDWLQ